MNVRHISPHTFATWVAQQVRQGFGLVPFVGSGLSATSGIITAQNFTDLLAWTVYRCVAPEAIQNCDRLDLRATGWPQLPKPAERAAAKEWTAQVFERVCLSCGLMVAFYDNRTVQFLYPKPAGKPTQLDAALRRPLVPRVLREAGKTEVDDSHVLELLRVLNREDSILDFSSSPEISTTSYAFIEESAVRCLHDWRCVLRFLSRLQLEREASPTQHTRLWLVDPDKISGKIVDDFNRHITQGKEPNLGHTMLCHLAARARIRTILTTNFDNLIEKSFRSLGEEFKALPVHLSDPLPEPDLVHSENFVLKLHGDLTETRADHSLDSAPSTEDKRRFFSYVRGRHPQIKSPQLSYQPGLLLVCGYSASDLRCVQLMKYILDVDAEALLLWICHSEADLANLHRIFHQQGYAIAGSAADLPRSADDRGSGQVRIVATVTDRTDLLLYDLYQRLTLSLPRGGFNYQFAHSVPPGTSFRPGTQDEQLSDYAQTIIRQLTSTKNAGRVVLADARSGLTAPLRQAFHQMLRMQYRCLWIEMEDFTDAASLAHQIFVLMALRLGKFALDLDQFVPSGPQTKEVWADHISRLLAHWNVDPSEWFIILYGRNAPGGCAGWREQYWNSEEYLRFETLLHALVRVHEHAPKGVRVKPSACRDKGSGFMVLYAPYSEARLARDKERELALDLLIVSRHPCADTRWTREHATWKSSELASRHRVAHIPAHVIDPDQMDPAVTDRLFDKLDPLPEPPDSSFEDNMEYVQNDWLLPQALQERDDKGFDSVQKALRHSRYSRAWDARRFLYGATLFRQSRHFSALLSEGVFPCPRRYNLAGEDSDWIRHQRVFGWLVNLNQRGHILFAKPGGFAWMYRDSRLGIQYLMECLRSDELQRYGFAAQARSRMHFWIGDWYGRAYKATGHVLPLLESVFHYAECLRYIPWAKPGRIDTLKKAVQYRRTLARRSITEIIKTLRMGRDKTIRFWLQDAAGDPWFSLREGSSRTSGGGGRRFLFELEEIFLTLESQASSRTVFGDANFAWTDWLGQLGSEFRMLPQLDNPRMVPSFAHPSPLAPHLSPQAAPRDSQFIPAGIERLNVYHASSQQWREALSNNAAFRLNAMFVDAKPDWGNLLGGLREHANSVQDASKRADELNDFLRKWRESAVVRAEGRDGRLRSIAQAVFDLAFLHVRRAKALYHSQIWSFNAIGEKISPLWVETCGLCWLAIDISAEQSASCLTEDFRLRTAATTVYGLALGGLGRFFEAHRRLNEAHATLFRTEGEGMSLGLAKIKLRRAEVHILEARLLRRMLKLLEDRRSKGGGQLTAGDRFVGFFEREAKVSKAVAEQWSEIYLSAVDPEMTAGNCRMALSQLARQHFAKLDDAVLSLETAERCLIGAHREHWEAQYYALRLLVYSEHWVPQDADSFPVPFTLAFRRRGDSVEAVKELYEAGRSVSHVHRFATLRLIDYALRAVRTMIDGPSKSGARRLEGSILTEMRDLEKGCGRYQQVSLTDSPLLEEYLERLR